MLCVYVYVSEFSQGGREGGLGVSWEGVLDTNEQAENAPCVTCDVCVFRAISGLHDQPTH